VSEFSYYQTVSLDGHATPLDFYRISSSIEETWDEIQLKWVETNSLTHMLIRGDVALDEVALATIEKGIELRKTLGTSDVDYLLLLAEEENE